MTDNEDRAYEIIVATLPVAPELGAYEPLFQEIKKALDEAEARGERRGQPFYAAPPPHNCARDGHGYSWGSHGLCSEVPDGAPCVWCGKPYEAKP